MNVILLTVDALRKDRMSFYGYTRKTTPFLDNLKKNCIVFNKAHTTGPYTQASFPGILTSSHYFDVDDSKKLSKTRTLISEVLKKKHIFSAGFHSNPYLSKHFGYNRGWDVFYDALDSEVDPNLPYERGWDLNKKIFTWLKEFNEENKERKEKMPFFLWAHYMDVHEPYIPEKKYVDQVNPSLNLNNTQMLDLFRNTLLKRDVSDPELVHTMSDLYDAHIVETDEIIKELFTCLEQESLLEDTVIIFGVDHGDEFADHGGLSHDAKMYKELTDAPLFIYQSTSQGKESSRVVSNLDIGPTILHLFGLNNDESFQGQSLLPLEGYQDRGCFGEALHKKTKQKIHSYTDGHFKIIHTSPDVWEIYNLEEDPRETENLVDKEEKVHELQKKLLPIIERSTRSHEDTPPGDDLLALAEEITI